MAQNWTRSHEQEVWVGFNQLSVGINTVEINMEKLVEKKKRQITTTTTTTMPERSCRTHRHTLTAGSLVYAGVLKR